MDHQIDHQGVLEAYGHAWAQSEEDKVRAWVGECWTPSSTYVNPLTDLVSGIDGLTRLILDYPVMFPDATILPTSEPEAHHEYALYPWRLSSTARIRLLGRDYGLVLNGLDVIQFDVNEKITHVVSFFGAPPDPPRRRCGPIDALGGRSS